MKSAPGREEGAGGQGSEGCRGESKFDCFSDDRIEGMTERANNEQPKIDMDNTGTSPQISKIPANSPFRVTLTLPHIYGWKLSEAIYPSIWASEAVISPRSSLPL